MQSFVTMKFDWKKIIKNWFNENASEMHKSGKLIMIIVCLVSLIEFVSLIKWKTFAFSVDNTWLSDRKHEMGEKQKTNVNKPKTCWKSTCLVGRNRENASNEREKTFRWPTLMNVRTAFMYIISKQKRHLRHAAEQEEINIIHSVYWISCFANCEAHSFRCLLCCAFCVFHLLKTVHRRFHLFYFYTLVWISFWV